MMQRRAFLTLTAGAFCALAGTAHAHAILAQAEPAVGATVHGPITTLRLRFTERLEPILSRVSVVDDAGRVIAATALVTEGDGRTLAAHVPALAPGHWRVRWRAVSVDTHVTEGDYSFTLTP
jgi:hypothetical protein